jgi:pimeloyl-ACP methyl ester carboxylesterase
MRSKLTFFLFAALAGAGVACAALTDPGTNGTPHAILLPGLARSGRSMHRMKAALEAAGYRTTVVGYPSTDKTVGELAAEHLAPAVDAAVSNGATRIDFVTHSLGGIVLRQYLARHPLPVPGRAVMLGPPNQGSEVVDRLGTTAAFRALNGPAGNQLGTDGASAPMTLPPPDIEFGVIAGTHSINWILSSLIPGRDDGKVSVERAKLPGMIDFVTAPCSHPFLMRDRDVIALTLRFLRTGRFVENAAQPHDAPSPPGEPAAPR